MQSRRQFIGTAAASAMFGLPNTLAAGNGAYTSIDARVQNIQLAPPSYAQTEIWGYDGQMPGTEIRLRQGQRVQRTLQNNLPQATSLHWHGIPSDNAMDGVAGLTQDAVAMGGNFDYDFKVPDAGTYWYHAHNRSTEQVARGLYGALIVEESEAPDVDREEVLILDDWLLNPDTAQIDPDFTDRHARSHAGRRGNFVATNGRYQLSLPVVQNERLRLRLINAANARIFTLKLAGLEGWIVALDGMPLPAPQQITQDMFLAPGQRIDLFVDVTADVGETAHLVRVDDNEGFSQVAFPVAAVGTQTRRGTPTPLPPNPDQKVTNLDGALRARLNMGGGAMGSLDAAIYQGDRTTFQGMVQANQFWAFNGIIGMTETPLLEADMGQTVRLEILNDTVFPHAMHLHGMHFREVLKDGTLGPLRDTLLTFGGDTREIAFMANNPGDWLFHCHMLSHADSGMITWLKVNA